jgi:hypothetical protein
MQGEEWIGPPALNCHFSLAESAMDPGPKSPVRLSPARNIEPSEFAAE